MAMLLLVGGGTRDMGMKTMLNEMGVVLDAAHLKTESFAAKSFLSQRGLGYV